MNPLIGYGLISGIGSLGSSLFGSLFGQHQSKDLMDYQYKLQQEAIDRQNLYNSPVEQVKRLKAAGLNQNLVYGSGVDGNQSSAASPSMANVRAPMANPLQDLASGYLQKRQLELQEIATRNAAFESRERQLKLRAETLGQLLENKYNDKTLDTRVKTLAQGLVNSMQRQKNLEASEALTWSQTRNEDNKLDQIWAQTEALKARTALTNQQALTEVIKRIYLRSNVAVNNAKIRQIASVIEFYDAGTRLRGQQGDFQELANDVKSIYLKWKQKHPAATLTLEGLKEGLGIMQQGMDIFVP